MTLKSYGDWVHSVAWSHDATQLASVSLKIVEVWDPATGQCVLTLDGHRDRVNSVAWSYDATQLASASWDGTVKIWDPTTGQCISTLEGHSTMAKSVAWSHDATWLASVSLRSVKIWDVATGQCVSTLGVHGAMVKSVAWSRDAARLALASHDGMVEIWDPATGPCVMFEIDHLLHHLRSHESDSNLLRTDIGTLNLRDVAHAIWGPATSGYDLNGDNTWITYQGEKLLWLPPEYRPSSFAFSGTALSIGCHTGRILFFMFTDSSPIQW